MSANKTRRQPTLCQGARGGYFPFTHSFFLRDWLCKCNIYRQFSNFGNLYTPAKEKLSSSVLTLESSDNFPMSKLVCYNHFIECWGYATLSWWLLLWWLQHERWVSVAPHQPPAQHTAAGRDAAPPAKDQSKAWKQMTVKRFNNNQFSDPSLAEWAPALHRSVWNNTGWP